MTWHGIVPTRRVAPIGFCTPNNCCWIVCPITHTFAARVTSSSVKLAPDAMLQRLISRYAGPSPRYCVFQLLPPNTTCVRPSDCGETAFTRLVCRAMASASLTSRVLVPCVPVRTPLGARPPASIQTRLSPRFSNWFCICAEPALPIATTQITAAMPMVMPSTVSVLRVLLRCRKRTPSRSRENSNMTGGHYPTTDTPHFLEHRARGPVAHSASLLAITQVLHSPRFVPVNFKGRTEDNQPAHELHGCRSPLQPEGQFSNHHHHGPVSRRRRAGAVHVQLEGPVRLSRPVVRRRQSRHRHGIPPAAHPSRISDAEV